MDKRWIKQDFLSDLPLGIVHIILSFVPIRDAIRTSILARKWRYIWASLPHLAFDHECVNPPIENVSHDKRLIHFISQTLFLHEGPIHTFELRRLGISMGESHRIHQWLLFLSRNDVKILVIESGYDDDGDDFEFDCPSSLYSCQNLTHIKLHVNTIRPPPPSFKGFLFLRSLDISSDKVSAGTIESIIALSPLLEKIMLSSSADSKMTICAPNLKYFNSFSGCHLSLCTPLLEEFVGCFLGTKSFSIGVESLVFHHLRTIKLSYVHFGNFQGTKDVIRLINGSPNLQKLEISNSSFFKSEAPELAFASLWDPYYTYGSLKVIKMDFFGHEMDEMKLLKLFLARSPVLEKMVYKPLSFHSDLELLNLTAQLLRFRRASTNAEIVILNDRVSSSLQLEEDI